MENFKKRWNITSNGQVAVILIVFALTGSAAAHVSKPVLAAVGIAKGDVSPWVYYLAYVAVIFPVYQALLMLFGFLAGQFAFFWAFEKKMLRTLGLGFLVREK